jgi:hypothetical protein
VRRRRALNLVPGEAAVRHDEAQLGRLGDQRAIGGVALGDGTGAQPGVLLVDHGCEEHITSKRGRSLVNRDKR